MDREHHSHLVAGRRHHSWTDRLWMLARELPVHEVAIDDIAEFDQDCWFQGRAPTCRQVAEHARRIQAADLGFPVILASDGSLMDGESGQDPASQPWSFPRVDLGVVLRPAGTI